MNQRIFDEKIFQYQTEADLDMSPTQKLVNFMLNYKIWENQGILDHKIIATMDCSFLKKSGEHTENMRFKIYDCIHLMDN